MKCLVLYVRLYSSLHGLNPPHTDGLRVLGPQVAAGERERERERESTGRPIHLRYL